VEGWRPLVFSGFRLTVGSSAPHPMSRRYPAEIGPGLGLTSSPGPGLLAAPPKTQALRQSANLVRGLWGRSPTIHHAMLHSGQGRFFACHDDQAPPPFRRRNRVQRRFYPPIGDPNEGGLGGRDLGRILAEVHPTLLLLQVIGPVRIPVAVAPDGA